MKTWVLNIIVLFLLKNRFDSMGKSYNMEDKYVRTMAELEKYACKWWPKEIREYADKLI